MAPYDLRLTLCLLPRHPQGSGGFVGVSFHCAPSGISGPTFMSAGSFDQHHHGLASAKCLYKLLLATVRLNQESQ